MKYKIVKYVYVLLSELSWSLNEKEAAMAFAC